jgi:hypothetical protein
MRTTWAVLLLLAGCASETRLEGSMQLQLRSRSKNGEASTSVVRWIPTETAFIVCDMWDDHWCKGAARRVGEVAPAVNRLLTEVRAKGAFIIHAPSSTIAFYKDTPARKRAQEAPFSKSPSPLSTEDRWGT